MNIAQKLGFMSNLPLFSSIEFVNEWKFFFNNETFVNITQKLRFIHSNYQIYEREQFMFIQGITFGSTYSW